MISAAAAGALGTSLLEPRETSITTLNIGLKRLPAAFEGLRIAQVSDIHFNSFMNGSHLEKVVELTNAQKPDVVLLTGDFVTAGSNPAERNKRAEETWPCADLLRKIEASHGCLAVLGNHDYDTNAEVVSEAVGSGGKIQVLRNQAKVLEKDGARLWMVGLDCVTASRSRPEEALRGVPREECSIVTVHEPDIADEMLKYPVDLQISGHSHGGQIRLPGVGALYLPVWARKYPYGYYRLGEYQLYTNRGIGVIGVPMRFMCPPEITVFTLRRTEVSKS